MQATVRGKLVTQREQYRSADVDGRAFSSLYTRKPGARCARSAIGGETEMNVQTFGDEEADPDDDIAGKVLQCVRRLAAAAASATTAAVAVGILEPDGATEPGDEPADIDTGTLRLAATEQGAWVPFSTRVEMSHPNRFCAQVASCRVD